MLIVGAGQSGLVIAFALMRDRVRNILVIDRAPEGQEGIWAAFARMPTLRSPKDQTGPDLGIPSLTFEAWYDARHGAEAFAGLGLIPTGDWHDYLQWYRRVLALPVRNGVAATAIAPGQLDDGGRCLLVTLSTGEVLAARKLVLATGQDGTGEWWMPDFVRALPADRRAHTCEIDRLRARCAGGPWPCWAPAPRPWTMPPWRSSTAPRCICSAAAPSRRWCSAIAGSPSPVPASHIGEMPDEWRWRVMGNIMRAREGFPADTYKRVLAFPDTSPCSSAATGPMHAWRMAVSGSRPRAGRSMPTIAICGTGIRQDVRLRPELASFADKIALWCHRYTPPPGEEDPLLAAYPYLGPDYRPPRTHAGRGAVAGRHPPVRHRLDPELRAVGQQHQCHDDGGAQGGGGRDARPVRG